MGRSVAAGTLNQQVYLASGTQPNIKKINKTLRLAVSRKYAEFKSSFWIRFAYRPFQCRTVRAQGLFFCGF